MLIILMPRWKMSSVLFSLRMPVIPIATLITKRRYDWFNDAETNPYLPYLYDGISNGEQGQIASTRMYLETPNAKWADSQVR